jgi:predicted Fe-S protein YdhL (DUF1289 family)
MEWTGAGLPQREAGKLSKSEAVDSPCNRVCIIDPVRNWCIGCGRTLDEIGEWATASDPRKRQILENISARDFTRASLKP